MSDYFLSIAFPEVSFDSSLSVIKPFLPVLINEARDHRYTAFFSNTTFSYNSQRIKFKKGAIKTKSFESP